MDGSRPVDPIRWRYVAGLLFSEDRSHVALVRKEKGPRVNLGLWNGIGGKIEDGESGDDAIIREFEEETGVGIWSWEHFATMQGSDWQVEWSRAFDDRVHAVEAQEDEPILVFRVDDLPAGLAQLVPVLIPLALTASFQPTTFLTNGAGGERGRSIEEYRTRDRRVRWVTDS